MEGDLVVAPWPPLPGEEPVVEALVQIGSAEIPYRRAGRGDPVLLLVPPHRVLPVGWLEVRVGSCLVIQPLLAPPTVDPGGWIRGLVDGLGLGAVELVTGGLGPTEWLELARLDPWRIRRVTTIAVGDEDH